MDWIANMPGPQFLFLYGVVIVLTLAACWWTLRQRDPTASLPVPPLPTNPDPYEIAYLRGGENQVTRVVIISLTQRGYLQVIEEKTGWFSKEQKIERATNHPDTRHLSPIEHSVFDWFFTPYTAREVFEELPIKVTSYCTQYEERFHSEQLLSPPEMESAAWTIGFGGALVILALGGFKLLVALDRGRSNVLFLIIMGIISLVILVKVCQPGRLSRRGEAYSKQLERAFEWMKEHVPNVTPAATDMTLPLLVGLYGVGVLAGTPFDYYQQMFSSGQSGGGFSGGFVGGCGGGGGGGGGGGCGGCGGG